MAYLFGIKLWCSSDLHIHINDRLEEVDRSRSFWRALVDFRFDFFYLQLLVFPTAADSSLFTNWLSWNTVMFGECKSLVMYHFSSRDCLYSNIFKSTDSDCILIYDMIFWPLSVCGWEWERERERKIDLWLWLSCFLMCVCVCILSWRTCLDSSTCVTAQHLNDFRL